MLWLLIYTIAIFFWSTPSKTEAATIEANPASTTGPKDLCDENSVARQNFEKKHVCSMNECISPVKAAEFSEKRPQDNSLWKNTVFVPISKDKVEYTQFEGKNAEGNEEQMCQATVLLGFRYECTKKTGRWTCGKPEVNQECTITFATKGKTGHLMLNDEYKPKCYDICSKESKKYGSFLFYHICAQKCCTDDNDSYTKRLFIYLREKSKGITGPILVPKGTPQFKFQAATKKCEEEKSKGWKSFECREDNKPCTKNACKSVSWNAMNGQFLKCN